MLLSAVCRLAFLPLASGISFKPAPSEPTTAPPRWAAERIWNGEMLFGEPAATYQSPDVQPTLKRGMNFTVDNVETSLIQRLKLARAGSGKAGGQLSMFLRLAADDYQHWETPEDSDGRRRLSRSVSEVSGAGPRDQELVSLLNRALPQGTVFEVGPTLSRGRARRSERRRLVRDDVLGHGGFNIIAAARILAPEARQSGLRGLLRSLRGCARGGNCSAGGSTGRRTGSRTEDEDPAPQAVTTSDIAAPAPVALRVAYASSRRHEVVTEEDARHVIRFRAEMQNVRSLLPVEVSSEQLINKYGFIISLFSGSITGMPALLQRDEHISLLNYVEAVPLMAADLFHVDVENHKNVLQFILKRLIQLGAHLAAAGIVHADVKLVNILLDHTGQLFLADFDSARRTGDKVACGTLPASLFYDPATAECILEDPRKEVELSPALDSWSFGVLFFGAACGRYPFPGMNSDSPRLEKLRVLSSLGTPEKKLGLVDWKGCGRIPENLRKIVEQMLDPNPATRLDLLDFFMNSDFFAFGRRQTAPQTDESRL